MRGWPTSSLRRGMAADANASHREAIDAALLDAHARGDNAALAGLYARAADMFEADGDTDSACFYLTQAYIFALEEGLPQQAELHKRLWLKGREEPLKGKHRH